MKGAEQLMIITLSNRVQTEISGRGYCLGFLFFLLLIVTLAPGKTQEETRDQIAREKKKL